ncbi:rab-GTPase-TBC domain-containing protein [Obelidium mucronatum]|nr:rab-GTPase-TBC domain-containing protein [Obelidium mucronatum]
MNLPPPPPQLPPLPPIPSQSPKEVNEYGFFVSAKSPHSSNNSLEQQLHTVSKLAQTRKSFAAISVASLSRAKSRRYSVKSVKVDEEAGNGFTGGSPSAMGAPGGSGEKPSLGKRLSRALSIKSLRHSIAPLRPSVPFAAATETNPEIIEQEKEWIRLLEAGSLKSPQNIKHVKRLCREGVPASLRWSGLDCIVIGWSETGTRSNLMEKQNSMEMIEIFEVIERDVARCYPHHIMFIDKDGYGINNLRGILRSYALYNPILGYTQGMGFIVGMLLMQIMSPEQVFWSLVSMLNGICKGFFESDLKRVRMDAKVFDMLVKNMDSKLAKYLESNQIDGLMYIPQWFLTVFTSCLPWPSVLRIWDMFICEGSKALFRMGLAILISSRTHLLTKCPTTSEALSYILHIPHEDPTFQPASLSKAMMKIRLRSRNLEKIRQIVEENWSLKRPVDSEMTFTLNKNVQCI